MAPLNVCADRSQTGAAVLAELCFTAASGCYSDSGPTSLSSLALWRCFNVLCTRIC